MTQVIVVGGGLAGLSAAHTVLEHGGKVLLLDKNSFMGGNSTKATSGINGALTRTQIKLNIPDSAEKFYDDTARSARDLIRPPLVKVLTHNSGSAVEWLQDKFALDLSLVSRLGGHSFPRTHRGKEKFPGMTITYALMEKLDDLARSKPDQVQIILKAKVTKLITESDGSVSGVEYQHNGQSHTVYGPVVLATGGYAADFAPDGLIQKYRPDIMDLPTTNGEHSTGDGIKMVKAIGGNSIDMEKVQVHPTGLVDPNEPDAKVKFLAAEALRGVGGILLTSDGKRFCDELGHRDYVTGEMWKFKKAPYRLILNGAASKEIEWHCKHYMGRNLMKKYSSGADLAKDMGISVQVLDETFTKYNEGAKNNSDPFGKKYFHNLPFNVKDEYYVAIVTPVVHYCMGGLEINHESEVLGPQGAIKGLFGAGEVCGGVHGANRLGGSSLLGCVVYGRVAGDSAARYLFQKLLSQGPGSKSGGPGQLEAIITQSGVQTKVTVSWGNNGAPSTQTSAPVTNTNAQAPANSAAPASAPKRDTNKEYTAEEVAKHNTEKDCWVIVNGQVLDVTSFLKDHPGGKKAILIYAGRDATEEFNMLHKADVVEKYAPESIIGRIKPKSKL
jgi:flavocytochrome c